MLRRKSYLQRKYVILNMVSLHIIKVVDEIFFPCLYIIYNVGGRVGSLIMNVC